jgi:hypothetical protein
VFACLPSRAALAQGAAELFAEGNDLARSGVYRTALLRYREAAAAGFDTALLHYNVGVVYYKLGEFAAAAAEFAQASAAPDLAALASYNRGLALRAAGERAAAAEAFAAAAETADQRALRRLADDAAAAALGGPVSRSAPAAAPRRAARGAVIEERSGDLRLSAAARLGQDDNAYRSPADSYVDVSDATQPLVTPVVHAAAFMPVELHAAYVLQNESGDTDFAFRYDMAGDFYDSEFANATEVDQRLSMGADIVLGERERRRRTLETAFVVRTHRETNYDPDNGQQRAIDAEDVSDRFSYKASGVQGEFAHRLGRWLWAFDLEAERRDYERTLAVENFDHDFFFAGLKIAYDLGDSMTLDFGVQQYRRLYDERAARDLTGALLTTNPAQEYDYAGVELGVTRRFGRAIELRAHIARTERVDDFLGYYDYTEDAFGVRATFHPTPRFDLAVGAIGASYDYPRAFAFHVPAAGALELEDLEAELTAEFHLTRRLTLWAELTTADVTSTDARAQFARTRTMLGVEWRR